MEKAFLEDFEFSELHPPSILKSNLLYMRYPSNIGAPLTSSKINAINALSLHLIPLNKYYILAHLYFSGWSVD
jgi:hypothetical protein